MSTTTINKPNLFSAVAIGVSCIIGSGWLFSVYYTAQSSAALSIVSWIIGATFTLILALLLSEVCTMFPKRALFARLLTISHKNRDFGFVVAISNWLGLVITVPSEAEATVQYLSSIYPQVQPYLFYQHRLTYIGLIGVLIILIFYGIINFWGIRLLTRANNVIVVFKVMVPLLTAIILFVSAFHAENFYIYKNTFAPYGIYSAFSTIVTCGIFYAFYGFGTVAFFCAEIHNPQKNIPLALISSIVICLFIYLGLQAAFIGAIPTLLIQDGWHQLRFVSPLAQLLILLNLNFWAVVLYIDAMVSPSGTACLYTGTAARNFTGMARDQQMPNFFSHLHPIYDFSRRSLILTIFICFSMVLFFRNWQKIMIVVSVFQLITCIAIPVSFYRLRTTEPHCVRKFRMPLGKFFSIIIFIMINYLLVQVGIRALILAFIMHIILFLLYCFSFYRKRYNEIFAAIKSSWSIFVFLMSSVVFGYLADSKLLLNFSMFPIFIVFSLLNFKWLLQQKNHQPKLKQSISPPATHNIVR